MPTPLNDIPVVSQKPEVLVNSGSLKLPAKINMELTKACAACGISKAELLKTAIKQFLEEFKNIQDMRSGSASEIASVKIELKIREVTTKVEK